MNLINYLSYAHYHLRVKIHLGDIFVLGKSASLEKNRRFQAIIALNKDHLPIEEFPRLIIKERERKKN